MPKKPTLASTVKGVAAVQQFAASAHGRIDTLAGNLAVTDRTVAHLRGLIDADRLEHGARFEGQREYFGGRMNQLRDEAAIQSRHAAQGASLSSVYMLLDAFSRAGFFGRLRWLVTGK